MYQQYYYVLDCQVAYLHSVVYMHFFCYDICFLENNRVPLRRKAFEGITVCAHNHIALRVNEVVLVLVETEKRLTPSKRT